jgi:hypothetical protein
MFKIIYSKGAIFLADESISTRRRILAMEFLGDEKLSIPRQVLCDFWVRRKLSVRRQILAVMFLGDPKCIYE